MLNVKLKSNFQRMNLFQLNNELVEACGNGHLDIVSYLLTSPELKEHADIHAQNDLGLIYTCLYKHLNIIKYLIFDFQIDKTNTIEQFLKLDKDKYGYIISMFEKRKLEKNLQITMIPHDKIQKTNKI